VHEIRISTKKREEMLEITEKVRGLVQKSGLKEGICLVFCPHTTAGLFINEHADPAVREDILAKLQETAPKSAEYRHLEGNADAHIKAALLGSSLALLVQNGSLALGTWQGIFLAEFDGPRERKIWLQILGK